MMMMPSLLQTKESGKRDNYLDFARKLKKAVKY